MVLATLVIVVLLANVILAIISSQSRLTHHQTSRIQAYYAAQAGMNLAMEQLRTGAWGTGAFTLCNVDCTINDPNIPYTVNIVIGAPGTSIDGVGRRIDITTTYTYTP